MHYSNRQGMNKCCYTNRKGMDKCRYSNWKGDDKCRYSNCTVTVSNVYLMKFEIMVKICLIDVENT